MRAVATWLFLLSGCGGGGDAAPIGTDQFVDEIGLREVGPATVVPGSVLVVEGSGFVHPDYGRMSLHFIGEGGSGPVELATDATYVSPERIELVISSELLSRLGTGEGMVSGAIRVELEHASTGVTRASNPLPVELALRPSLEPALDWRADGTMHVNSPVRVSGDGLLLGGAEGDTVARVEGCFTAVGETECLPAGPVEVMVRPDERFDRRGGWFPFAPEIAGVAPGRFVGTVQLVNFHGPEAGGAMLEGPEQPIELDVSPPAVYGVDVTAASLGQFVDLRGGGFVDATEADAITLLEVEGTFRSEASGVERPLALLLVPEFRDGEHVRYVLSEEDALGTSVSLRRERGTIEGTIRPVVRFRGVEVRGDAVPFTFEIAPMRQIIVLSFQPSYVESLRHFGLRAVEPLLRDGILRVAQVPYEGVNVEFRRDLPEDFAVFSIVDIAGTDPNHQGLFGYDNTPGKDVMNLRLHDRIGGVNARTQADGFPGYGGVFIESFMAFSNDPGGFVEPLPGATDLFDAIFDPFRPDRGGRPVTADDLVDDLPEITDGSECPAPRGDRPLRIACAVYVLSNVVGSTVSHEVGHSLGLANPHGDGFHNNGDLPHRLMDAGGARPFEERAQIMGETGSVFCDEEYGYLQEIMPTAHPDPLASRPACF